MTERFIDLRSDTVTRPTPAMRQAMFTAEVGDDVIGEDPTIHRLEALAAEMTGREAALFVPSGTFGNQVCIMTHCRPGHEVIVSELGHIVQHEVGGAAVLSAVQLRTVWPRGSAITWAEIEPRIRRDDDIHFPDTGLIALENAVWDGTVQPLEEMVEIHANARRLGIPVHLDGARIFNAAASLGVPAAAIACLADSVMFCLSKGLAAPVGSMVVGDAGFIHRARKMRKLMGGGMRQAGILAAAGIVALTEMVPRLSEDHHQARRLAEALAARPELELAPDRVDINMVFVRFRPGCGAEPEARFVAALRRLGILTYPPEGGRVRFVTHHDVTAADIDRVIARLEPALAEVRAGGC
ncbi:MAG TPA: GntG family PLP-dependent aldolase [Acidobacteriota bacterium]|jgi:threonine aldolase|nr:GntG family PLP-dependent aldolase [Acidobacteriota bacterium]HNU00503.1 GntG family PLP-dependent aldolase [Acidobacteriota bacterium]HQP74685.1 GntG family PLP-dependent aldolase [Acidobacteriota bacterium]